jgi:DNA polymerase-3 subunit delta
VGSEPLLRDQGLAAIRQAVLSGSSDDFNLDRLDGDRLSPGRLLESVQTLPLMAEHRLVIVKDPQLIAHKDSREALFDALLQTLTGLVEQTETVMVVTAAKADSRLRWVKAFKGSAAKVECAPPKSAEAAIPFIETEAKSQGVTLEAGVARELADRVGPHLLILRGELAKAALMAGDRRSISLDHVRAGTSDLSERFLWDLTDPLCAGQAGAAIAQLNRLFASGYAPEAVLGSLAGHFRKLACIRGGGTISGSPFQLRKLNSQAARHSQRSLRTCLERIHRTDASLKGIGQASKHMSRESTVESLVLELSI